MSPEALEKILRRVVREELAGLVRPEALVVRPEVCLGGASYQLRAAAAAEELRLKCAKKARKTSGARQ